jgi:hypothetical protein
MAPVLLASRVKRVLLLEKRPRRMLEGEDIQPSWVACERNGDLLLLLRAAAHAERDTLLLDGRPPAHRA